MAQEYNAEKRHQEICDYIHEDLYLPKNAAYGDSFHKLYSDLGTSTLFITLNLSVIMS